MGLEVQHFAISIAIAIFASRDLKSYSSQSLLQIDLVPMQMLSSSMFCADKDSIKI